MNTVLVFFALLAACIWVGGFVALVVVARVARRELERPAQVAFFRSLGRAYGLVGGAALVVGLGCGGVLLAAHGWDATALTAVVVAGVLVVATVVGVRQARAITRLRARVVRAPGDTRLAAHIRRAACRAAILRGAIGTLSIALVALAAVLVV